MANKSIFKVVRAASLGIGLALATATAASSATVNVTYQGSNAFGSPNLSRYLQVSSKPYTGGVYAGPFRLTGSGGMGNFIAFCIDLGKFMTSGSSYTTAAASGLGAAVDTNINRLFTSAYKTVSTRVQGAAFQVALWEIITDTGRGFNLGKGGFSVVSAGYSAAIIKQANQYLGGLATAGTGGYKLTYMNSGTSQNIVTVSPVPVPAAFGMLGLGLAALFGLRWRRKVA